MVTVWSRTYRSTRGAVAALTQGVAGVTCLLGSATLRQTESLDPANCAFSCRVQISRSGTRYGHSGKEPGVLCPAWRRAVIVSPNFNGKLRAWRFEWRSHL